MAAAKGRATRVHQFMCWCAHHSDCTHSARMAPHAHSVKGGIAGWLRAGEARSRHHQTAQCEPLSHPEGVAVHAGAVFSSEWAPHDFGPHVVTNRNPFDCSHRCCRLAVQIVHLQRGDRVKAAPAEAPPLPPDSASESHV